jgi:23S rRNA pseudoU1915 N3-methylase RlmH
MSRSANKTKRRPPAYFQRLETRKGYSKRSQNSWRVQREMERELANCARMVANSEDALQKCKDEAGRIVTLQVSGRSIESDRLAESIRAREDEEKKLAAYKRRQVSIRRKIDSFRPTRNLMAPRGSTFNVNSGSLPMNGS